MNRRVVPLIAAITLVASACSSGDEVSNDGLAVTPDAVDATSSEALDTADLDPLPQGEEIDFGPAPAFQEGDLDPEVVEATNRLISGLFGGRFGVEIETIVDSGDGRLAWILADLLRFFQGSDASSLGLAAAFEDLTGADIDDGSPWSSATNHLIAWDLPAPPGYLDFKREIFLTVERRWDPLFDADADIDWRHVSWGGVLIDERPLGNPDPCSRGCIPALDDPAVTDADGGDWFPDERVVFGVVVDGEARAYPKNIMEVHEMINDDLGGRRIAVPYCTLCGSAQAYYTDTLEGFEQPVFRTSGLLIRSNKMMFELNTRSFVDTFLGNATSGPLLQAGVQFEQISVITSTWGDWKLAHPNTTIVAEDGGIGRSYPDDPLGDRDANGPIFPIGDVDVRLPAQEQVLGLITGSGTPIAVHVASAGEILASGGTIEVEDLTIQLEGAGLRATRTDGTDAGGHQAFWFAWSQFHTDTLLWPEDFG